MILYPLSHFPLSVRFSNGFEPPESAATSAVSIPGATAKASPRGYLQGQRTTSVPQHHLLTSCMHQALCHQEGKRSVRRLQRLEFTCVQPLWFCWHECGLRDSILSILNMSLHFSLSALLLSLSSSSKPRQRASQLRWILMRLWWKTSSVWMRWRGTWQLFSMHCKMNSHATSASEPRQVFSLFLFLMLSACVSLHHLHYRRLKEPIITNIKSCPVVPGIYLMWK